MHTTGIVDGVLVKKEGCWNATGNMIIGYWTSFTAYIPLKKSGCYQIMDFSCTSISDLVFTHRIMQLFGMALKTKALLYRQVSGTLGKGVVEESSMSMIWTFRSTK